MQTALQESRTPSSEEVLFGPPLEKAPGEIDSLVSLLQSGKLVAKHVVEQEDGDVRHWGVDPNQSSILQRLMEFATRCYRERTGRAPEHPFIMMNEITAERAPRGSGGAWHRDSFRPQYKAFVYLTDVNSEANGPLCIIPGSNNVALRTASLAAWILTGRRNHNQPAWIAERVEKSARRRPVLAPAGTPFFTDTSLIHKGLPITSGRRIAATVYMFGPRDREFRVNGELVTE